MAETQSGPTDAADVINMNDKELMRDPFRGYSWIRERTPIVRAVMHGVDPVWLVTRYDDVRMVLTDPRFVIDSMNVPELRGGNRNRQMQESVGVPPEYLKYRMATMDEFDGTDHARLRTPAAPAFTARRIAQLRTEGERITKKLLDRLPEVAEDGVVDLLAHFVHPLACSMASAAVGIPKEDWTQWQEWYRCIWSDTDQERAEAWRGAISYLEELLERRSAAGESGEMKKRDLVSTLIRYRDKGAGRPRTPVSRSKGGGIRLSDKDIRLTDTEIISLIIALGLTSQGGAHMIGEAVLALLTHPDQLALLRGNPDLLPRAIHELLRWTTPTHVAPHVRYPTEDVDIGGTVIRKGEAVAAVLAAANYDPRKFDEPHRLDITREPDRSPESHVSFGAGTHYCMGASLTRLKGELAFEGLLGRYPDLTLAVAPDDLEYKPIPFQILLTALPVRL